MTVDSVSIAGREIQPGERARVDIPLPNLYTTTPVYMPVHVVRGRKPGPRLFVTASIHGDEINGVEIIRRMLLQKALSRLRGTLLAVPVVNVYGYVRQSRYLPDRRDLNRSFPGSDKGSLAARLATTLISEVVEGSTHGIDLHTGAIHRENLPQIRVTLNAGEDMPALAKAFETPVILDAEIRPGSLRAEAAARGIPILLYEGGEALRFDEFAVRAGLRGILGVMRHIGMIRSTAPRRAIGHEPLVARSSVWVRAHQSGILLSLTPLGAHVNKGDTLGIITDPFRPVDDPVLSPVSGIVIGRTNLPLITEGEALYHLACFGKPETAAALLEEYRDALDPDDEEETVII
ncbi:succinylglutamate desuccinylase/aspartoacylase family protein [Thiocapsa marina]|uniref:Succinylglutamate desuccinylase/aspartoacylase n=1 Tax=Thiocapsa marina 5811 TaxID=768671 RepID=F9UBD4_9GAMM|nr:succinylglutamate desuccinylase/aspartoacylase family protein [Thiocapsa marina]EGV18252.1 Succinylglutamate desuccinylase/aspartoacylase [Thiocapsa marina 5811]